MKLATATAATHPPVECKQDNRSAQFHMKSWSYRFTCPTCGNSKRQNTNYLGRRLLICDGQKIVMTHKEVLTCE